jgi:mannose-6-phosphate isomerase-like protein (cupin superfamily)
MTKSEIITQLLPNGHQGNGEWLQITPGERFKIHTSIEETEGAFATVELVADPRSGPPMHVHKNEDEHFIVLEGTLHIANGDKIFDAPAGTAVTVKKGGSTCLVQFVGDSPSYAGRPFTWAHRATLKRTRRPRER